ncbi:hypothetical protein VNO77_42535 [Canavalia gladiata]|uniref:Vesicle transport v-SNARE N-terminal domain-containing protein n=1 Tax=Canavalia gladiata TaxID=3824 RepID=A0AAN9JSF8_CANGL
MRVDLIQCNILRFGLRNLVSADYELGGLICFKVEGVLIVPISVDFATTSPPTNLRRPLRSSSDPIDWNWKGRVEKLETMSEVFEGYERQYCELSVNLSRECTAASALDGEQKKQKLSEVKAGLDDAEALIRKMDLEARSLQPSMKATLLAKLREYRTDLNNLKSQVKRVTSANVSVIARDELLESGNADTVTVSDDQRGKLLMSTERLNQSSDRIKDSRRTMLETEELGVSILQDLHQQRQSLLHAHKTLHGVDDNISKSKKILTAMSRRMNRNKWIVGSLMTALILAIIFILYFKLTH